MIPWKFFSAFLLNKLTIHFFLHRSPQCVVSRQYLLQAAILGTGESCQYLLQAAILEIGESCQYLLQAAILGTGESCQYLLQIAILGTG